MSETLTEKVSFDIIRYANCWEDADILLEGLNPQPGSRILSIGSAGDNSFSLLTTDPELVVAVDVNKVQLHLIELKQACIRQLPYEEVLAFLGFRPSEEREKTFHQLKGELSDEARRFWENNLLQVKKGLVSQGKFEQYFRFFKKRVLPWVHSQKEVEALLRPKTAQEQEHYYAQHWNTWRWRMMFRVFFSKYIMGKYGRDPEFLREVKVPVGDYIFKKAERHLQSEKAQQNYMLRFNLTGSFGDLLPHYLQPENFVKVKANLDKLRIKEGYAEAAVAEYGTFHAMNLSNIFEYMNRRLFERAAGQLLEATAPGGKLAYWNLMVPRRISGSYPSKAVYLKETSRKLSEADKGFFYNQFIVDQVT
ncbi:DUF3419 family protein [Botryobacter ruber]|uniref:DUF3419 family protein n=1 Tax=Botryobacter ruber TaxID=2171629 RepID=UPI000E0A0E85|nr:DUF3419 family protein [Botryobacter ruber]